MKTRWFFAFFFISGFCSLVYEVVWLRLCMAKFGVTTPMVSIVLSVFMAGLGIGSWAGGALIKRAGRSAALPLRLYRDPLACAERDDNRYACQVDGSKVSNAN